MTQSGAVREVSAAQGEQGASADNLGHRPLLRGWLHFAAFIAWVIGGPFLIAAGPDAPSKAVLTVYVLSMLVMFGTSALFHRVRWSAPAWRRMRRADHSAIFIGIAGTSTAVAGLALSGWSQALMLSLVWAGALRRHRFAPGVAGRAPVGGCRAVRGRRLVLAHRGPAARAQPGLGRLRARCSSPVCSIRPARSSTPASGRTHGRVRSGFTRSSMPAPWWARGSSPISLPSSPFLAIEDDRARLLLRCEPVVITLDD